MGVISLLLPVSSYLNVEWFFFVVLEFEQVYLDNLPNAESYEKSYMHRDVVTHLAVAK